MGGEGDADAAEQNSASADLNGLELPGFDVLSFWSFLLPVAI